MDHQVGIEDDSIALHIHLTLTKWDVDSIYIYISFCVLGMFLLFGVDITTIFAISHLSDQPFYLEIDDQYAEWYERKYVKILEISLVIPMQHDLQGNI